MAKKVDYTQLAKEVIRAVGGKENINGVTNCMTRLRFVLKDDSIPNSEEVKLIKDVKGVMNKGGQYQVIIGTHVNEVIKFVNQELGFKGDEKATEDKVEEKGNFIPVLGWLLIFNTLIAGLITSFINARLLEPITRLDRKSVV